MAESRCGVLCSRCEYAKQAGCPGCVHIENPFWGVCPVKACCEEKGQAHCGVCREFPCDLLTRFAYDPEQGDDGRRIEQCRIWAGEEKRMDFKGVCILTDRVAALASFYEKALQAQSEGDEVHTVLPARSLTIYAKEAARRDMGFDFGRYDGAGNFTLSFEVDDVDGQYERLRTLGVEFVALPKTYPWGSRSLHFRDPDGNIVTFFSAAKQKEDI